MEINFTPTKKQGEILTELLQGEKTELVFGGGAGGGKSYIGCVWLIIQCLQYKAIRCLIGRAKLSSIKQSTLITLFEIFKRFKLNADKHYKYNATSNTITFFNGSTILLKDLETYPSDPNFDSLGSVELTFAFVDEANQITEKAKNVLISRVGRCKNSEYNLTPKTLFTCNPAKGWIYEQFYLAQKKESLSHYRYFLQSLVTDNPHIPQSYIDNLNKLDDVSKKRLLLGMWEYGNELNIFNYDEMLLMFKGSKQISDTQSATHITADIARLGKDKTEIFIWNNLELIDIHTLTKQRTNDVANYIKDLEKRFKVRRHNILIDTDGVGAGVSDNLIGCKEFHNGSKAVADENYQNLKTQCIFHLAKMIDQIEIYNYNVEFKEELIKVLSIIERINIDKDGKLQCTSKETIKQLIGKSPDGFDALYMRMYFELKPKIFDHNFKINVVSF
jgi:phage terminase large subunit